MGRLADLGRSLKSEEGKERGGGGKGKGGKEGEGKRDLPMSYLAWPGLAWLLPALSCTMSRGSPLCRSPEGLPAPGGGYLGGAW